jgi:hypothetical protein
VPQGFPHTTRGPLARAFFLDTKYYHCAQGILDGGKHRDNISNCPLDPSPDVKTGLNLRGLPTSNDAWHRKVRTEGVAEHDALFLFLIVSPFD